MEYPNAQTVIQEPRNTVPILIALMAAALAIAYFLLPQSLRLDESQTLWQISRSAGNVLAIVGKDVHVPLYHELLHGWITIVGNSVIYARAFSLLLFLIGIPAIYMLGSYAYGKATGLYAAAIFALSPFMNWYASEIRMYTFFALFTILNQYFFLRIMRERGAWNWLGYILTALIGIYVHYFFFLVLASEAVFFLLRRSLFPRGTFWKLAATAVLVCLAIAPWIWYVFHLGQAQNNTPHLATPTSVDLFSTFSQFLFGFQIDPVNAVILSFWPLAIVFMFLALRSRIVRLPETEFFVTTIVVSFAAVFLVSIVVPLFVSRYLIFTLPSIYLLIANLFSKYPRPIARSVQAGLIVLMLAGLTVEIVNAQTPVKEDYKDATNYLTQHAGAQDVIIISAPFTIYPVQYYYRGTAPMVTLPAWNRYVQGAIPAFDAATMPSQVQQETQNAQYAWVLLSYNQGYETQIRDYFDAHYQQVFKKVFSPDLTLYAYKIRYDTYLSKVTNPNKFTDQ